MKSFISVLISVIVIPIMMIAFGLLWRKHPPKNINWIYGYRSRRSMKNHITWQFAHKYQAKIWYWSGLALLVFSLIFALLFKGSYKEIPGWIFYMELAVMILSIIPTEVTLAKIFNKEGNLR